MVIRANEIIRLAALFFAAVTISAVRAQQGPTAVDAVQLTGLPDVKENTKGKLSVENGNLHFMSGKNNSEVSATSIQDVVTGADSQKAVGKTIGILSMAAPYGGGRVVSLFRKKIDTLTVEYRDANGAFHGVIFTMPLGTADVVKQELIAQGAHTTISSGATSAQRSTSASPKEQKQ